MSEDPYGTLDFVEWGQRRDEVREDLDLEMMASSSIGYPARSKTPFPDRVASRFECSDERH